MNIPTGEKVEGLEYGARWTRERPHAAGYWVRANGGPWVPARETPESNELPDDYFAAYAEYVEELHEGRGANDDE